MPKLILGDLLFNCMNKEYDLQGINIELTTYCPLHCKQCYCTLEGAKYISKEIAIRAMHQAADLGATHVELSGGETMCYPHLYELIAAARSVDLEPSIAISGWGINDSTVEKLIDAGIDSIYVSLNGPTEIINSVTRDGFQYSISALEALKKAQFHNTVINWVMHRNTANMLSEMIDLAEQYQVNGILIIEPMPTAKGELNTYPFREQLLRVAEMVKTNSGKVDLQIQHCFSPLLALASDNKLWGNSNRGIYKGCTAGIASCAIDVDGHYSPCRHLPIVEEFSDLKEYWKHSSYLQRLREMEYKRQDLCFSCRYAPFCRHCQARNWIDEQDFYIGRKQCEVYVQR